MAGAQRKVVVGKEVERGLSDGAAADLERAVVDAGEGRAGEEARGMREAFVVGAAQQLGGVVAFGVVASCGCDAFGGLREGVEGERLDGWIAVGFGLIPCRNLDVARGPVRRMRRAWLSVVLLVALMAAGCAAPEAEGGPETPPTRPSASPAPDAPRIALEPVVEGLSKPLGVLEAPDGSARLLVVEQGGLVRVAEAGVVRAAPFLDLRDRVSSGSEQGLLGLAFEPNTSRVFASFTDASGRSTLVRYQYEPASLVALAATESVLLVVDQPFSNHNGGHLVFGPDGMLYFGLGDGGSAGDPVGNAQNPETLLGSILRLDVSGDAYAVPPDNPFSQGGGRGEVFHFGLRNPWRFSFDRDSGDLFIGDVGQNKVEEVDFAPAGSAGLNFGWNVWEGSESYRGGSTRGNATFPVAEYTHAATGGCSVTGGHVYRGTDVPGLAGVYLYSDFCSGHLWALQRAGPDAAWETSLLLDTDLMVSSFGESAAGELFVVDHRGAVHRIVAG